MVCMGRLHFWQGSLYCSKNYGEMTNTNTQAISNTIGNFRCLNCFHYKWETIAFLMRDNSTFLLNKCPICKFDEVHVQMALIVEGNGTEAFSVIVRVLEQHGRTLLSKWEPINCLPQQLEPSELLSK